MLILVANLGSTSFKYKLLDMSGDYEASNASADSRVLARGAVDRIGEPMSQCEVTITRSHQGETFQEETKMPVPDHGVAVQACLDQLTHPENGCLKEANEVSAIGFKAVHGGRKSGTFVVDDDVLEAMNEMSAAAPAHNPPYIAAMKLLRQRFPELPLVAAFETEFHDSISPERRTYAIPADWTREMRIQKWGFHGSSHRYIAERTAEILGRDDAKIISCHLGGSSSLTAIDSGKSVMTTMGMTPQTGVPQNNRVGDFDAFAIPLIMQRTGQSLDEVLQTLASQGGLKGLSGGMADLRDIEGAAADGNADAKLALGVYIEEIRRHLGGMMVALGRLDAIVFTGGIGENSDVIRAGVCAGLEGFGIEIDTAKNDGKRGEGSLHTDASKTQILIVPTNEEWIVAKRSLQALAQTP
ncbi:acetate/propionate family kinase [Rhodopirellula sp. JC740]|uniref:Acetate kinase n=1 Tax=Rhodopirellula halodulae TaxID=2894198 RepID=A0ABS8NBG6_9BACT|nr:acetate/propionate family kinase [Rhodopirellula sp. JC740]MCC9640907.1 acetate/propionate family kinase [Rhodopirellula sp. JC740]